jgi:hypothetical protein
MIAAYSPMFSRFLAERKCGEESEKNTRRRMSAPSTVIIDEALSEEV